MEELERLLAVETGGEELGARKFFVSTKKSFEQGARKFFFSTKQSFELDAHKFFVSTKESIEQNRFGRDLCIPRRGRDRSCDDGCEGSSRSKRLLNHAGMTVVVYRNPLCDI